MSDVGVDAVGRVVPENVVSPSVFAFGHSTLDTQERQH